MFCKSKIRTLEVSAIKILADGSTVDLGVIAFVDYRPLWRRILDRLKGKK